MWQHVIDYGAIILSDIVLSGDNALIIGMAAAGLSPELRKKALIFGLVIAAVLRILFAGIATTLLNVPGLLFIGSLALFYVCWGLYKEIKHNKDAEAAMAMETAEDLEQGYQGAPKRTLGQALWTITIADVSMSIDNVLAIAAIADGDVYKLVIGLALAIFLMSFFATMIMRLMTKYPAISWAGLIVLIFVSSKMFYDGVFDPDRGLLAYFGLATSLG